jgi:hypothetical protein
VAHAGHDVLVAGASDNRGENGARRIVSGESGLAHARAVVNNEGGNVFHAWVCGVVVG